ncbi:flagellar motor switch protein FliN [Agromyces sp. NPDC057679]|uniref:flagellar motor switch protein FliN n=1 Tax=Agromyces sp. NPDC057679 TaxID=3346207 RepID=UPI00366E49EF
MTTQDLSAVADALVNSLPTTKRLIAAPATGPAEGKTVYTATLVGSPSAQLAITFADDDYLSESGVAADTAVTPAFIAAGEVIAVGQLSDVTTGGRHLLEDDEIPRFALLDSAANIVGWFAVQVDPTGRTGDDAHLSEKLQRVNPIEVALTVVIGSKTITLGDMLNMKPGDVVELDRAAGAPADIRVNNRLVALGEVVVVDQDYGIRITRILEDGVAA